MNQKLRQIYDDLSSGNLSQQQALDRIKAIKLHEHGKSIAVLLLTPVWQARGVEGSAGANQDVAYGEHHVVVCGLSQVDLEKLRSLLPRSQCQLFDAGEQKTIAQRYSEYALASFELIRTIFQDKLQGRVLVQIVIADHPEQAVLAGLSGLLKTAVQENPQLVGQLLLVPADMTSEELAQRLREEKTRSSDALNQDPVIRYNRAGRHVLGWQEVRVEERNPPIAFQDRGVYLITGGLGGLGVLFGKEILEQTGHGRVVLTGRSA